MISAIKWILLFSMISITACSDHSELALQQELVIQVDRHHVSLQEFNEFFDHLGMNYQREDGVTLHQARVRYLLQLLEEMLIVRRAEELGLTISPEAFSKAAEEIKQDYTDDGFQEMLMKQAVSMQEWEKHLRRQLLIEQVIKKDLERKVVVTPDDIRHYFDEHEEIWHHAEGARVLHILVSDKKEASQLLKKIKNGADFSELARAHSTAPEAPQGGDMGFVERGNLPEELEDPIFALKKNETSPVVRSPFGFHIFKVIEKRGAGKPVLSDIADEIRRRVKEQKVKSAYGPWLAELRSRYKVTVNEEII